MYWLAKKVIDLLSSEPNAERITAAIFFILLILVSFGPVSYNDFFWHLALGKWMIATGSFLVHDIFSYTFEGKLWMNQTWLFDGFLYLIYERFGYLGLNFLRLFIFSASYFIFFKLATPKDKHRPILSIAFLVFTLPLIRNLLRPEITAPLFVGIFLYILYRYRNKKNGKILFLLPLLEIIWVNTHGSFYIGPILIGVFFGSEFLRRYIEYRKQLRSLPSREIKSYFIAGICTALATLINPYSYSIYGFVARMLGDIETLSAIQEWLPISARSIFTFAQGETSVFVILFWLLLITLFFSLVSQYRSATSLKTLLTSLNYEDFVIAILFCASAFQYNRGMYLFSLVAAFLISRNLPNRPWLLSQTQLILLTCAGLFFNIALPHLRINAGPNESENPKYVQKFVHDNALQGPLLNEYTIGSDLIWSLYPDYKVFIDGRAANLYDADFLWYYNNLTNERIAELLTNRYKFNFIIFPNSYSFTKKISESTQWQLVFFDNAASVYLRNNEANIKLIESFKYRALNPAWDLEKYRAFCSDNESREILMYELGRNLKEVPNSIHSSAVLANISVWCPDKTTDELLSTTERSLKNALTLQPDNLTLIAGLGAIQLNRGEFQSAYATFKRGTSIEKNKNNLTGLGTALFNMGKYAKAARILKYVPSAIGLEPITYYQMYGRTLYHLDENKKAIAMMRRYLDLADEKEITAADYMYLSRAYADAGDAEAADTYLKKAQELSS